MESEYISLFFYPRCLVDPKLTGSSSRFMPRTQIDKLQFQLEAFRFQQEISGFVCMLFSSLGACQHEVYE